jgi:hypothetical protein
MSYQGCVVGPTSLTSFWVRNSLQRMAKEQLCDFSVPAMEHNYPHPIVMNRLDGHITSDIFEEVKSGYYAFNRTFLLYSLS